MKFLLKLIGLGLGLTIIGAIAAVALLLHLSSDLPQIIGVEDYKPLLVSEVYDREGKKIGEFFREKRILVPYEQIPENLVYAFIAAEDSSFFEHHGVNFVAIFRAAIANVKAGRRAQGASTITQQVARSLMLTPEKTYTRKIKEMILAYRMESHLSKEDILYLYLNQIYFGQGAYGVATAAKTYFRKDLKDLAIEEMAILAGLPKAPTRFSPIRNPKSAKRRQLYVLRRMAEEGYIPKATAIAAGKNSVNIFERKNYKGIAPYYLETVRQLLVSQLGEKAVLDEGLKVYTGLDVEKQLAANVSVERGLRDLDKRQGFRGAKKNITSDEEIVKFLEKSRNKLISERYDQKVMQPDGTFKALPELQLVDLPNKENINQPLAWPNYLSLNDIVEGVVIGVDDKWGLVKVRYAEQIGIIDIDTMKWAREPNPEVRARYGEIQKPSQALKVGDVVDLRVIAKTFTSERLKKELWKAKQKNKRFKTPEEFSYFDRWTHVQLEQEPIAEASLISFDQDTQDVLAMVGGYNFERSEFNRVLQSARQTGSAFKAIVYAAAMDRKYTPASLITDAPIVYEEEIEANEDQEASTKRWKPSNHSRSFNGEILFRNALIRSLNVPAVKILQDIGIEWVADYARRLGIFSPLNMDFTLGLGSSGVTLYEVTKMFSQFGRLGYRIRPQLIHHVTSREGEELLSSVSLDQRFQQEIGEYDLQFEDRRKAYLEMKALAEQELQLQKEESLQAQVSTEETQMTEEKKAKERELTRFKNIPPLFFNNPDQLMKPQTAYLITSLLQGTVHEARGTGIRARALGHPVAAKTGSTSGYYDGWFIGYTSHIATGVWVGFDKERTLGKGEVGGNNALPIWLSYMKPAHTDLPVRSFSVPEDIIFANIDNETGKLASANTKNYVRQAFLDGTEPQETSNPNQIEDATDFYKQDYSE